jgi:hypothetical protein
MQNVMMTILAAVQPQRMLAETLIALEIIDRRLARDRTQA